MIETYTKNSEFIKEGFCRAVQLVNTPESIKECVDFVIPDPTVDDTSVLFDWENSMIVLTTPVVSGGLVTLGVEFGNYIVQNIHGDFKVVCEDVFDAWYTRFIDQDSVVEHSREKMKKWHEEQKA